MIPYFGKIANLQIILSNIDFKFRRYMILKNINLCQTFLIFSQSVFFFLSSCRLSWFIIYSIFVFLLSAVGVVLLFTLQMFQHTHFLPIFLLVVLYSFSVIMFAFMITPFFDKSRVSNSWRDFPSVYFS